MHVQALINDLSGIARQREPIARFYKKHKSRYDKKLGNDRLNRTKKVD